MQKISVEALPMQSSNNRIKSFLLKNDAIEIEITNLGCIILSIKTPGKSGVLQNIVAGLKKIN